MLRGGGPHCCDGSDGGEGLQRLGLGMMVLTMEGYGREKCSRFWEKRRGVLSEKVKGGRACFPQSSNRMISTSSFLERKKIREMI